jgi:hypothetical protein
VPAGSLADWMVRFQFDDDVDYFEIDPVAYAPAMGKSGMATYRARLSNIEAGLGPRPSAEALWTSRHSHAWFVIEWNARRLAVLDSDITPSSAPTPATATSRGGGVTVHRQRSFG